MYRFLRAMWSTVHEPRIVTLTTVLLYLVLGAFGAYGLYHTHWGPAPFWQISVIFLLCLSPPAAVAAWKGMWQVERPLIFGISGALVLNMMSAFYASWEGGFRFSYVVVLALTLQAFVARWVRIKTSYVSPGRMASEYRNILGD